MTQIKSIAQLRKLSTKHQLDCSLALSGGFHSSKSIYYYPDLQQFEVFHGISGEVDMYTEQELLEESNIGEAIKLGALYAD